MPTLKIRNFESSVQDPLANDAWVILSYAHLTADALYDSFCVVREKQGSKGTTTDEQQDLLRSMLVLALAGLDSSTKQLVTLALPALVGREAVSADALLEFGTRRLSGLGDRADANRLLLSLMIDDEPRQRLVSEFVEDLAGDSLQSVGQLMRVVNVLGVESPTLRTQVTGLEEAFGVRNNIIHRMDINFSFLNRNRTSRSIAKLVPMTNQVLETAEAIVLAVDELLTSTKAANDEA